MVTRIGPRKPFRHYLKQWREYRDLTQQQLADRVGTGKDQVSRWESGQRTMSASVIAALADALQIQPRDIFRDPDAPSADDLLKSATPEQRRQAFAVIETLLKTGSDDR